MIKGRNCPVVIRRVVMESCMLWLDWFVGCEGMQTVRMPVARAAEQKKEVNYGLCLHTSRFSTGL